MPSQSQPSWSVLVYRLVQQAKAEPEIGRLLMSLPSQLTSGASTLEIARVSRVKPDRVEPIMENLASYRVVEMQPSGASVRFANSLYYLNPEGKQFFREVEALLSSSNASGAAAF